MGKTGIIISLITVTLVLAALIAGIFIFIYQFRRKRMEYDMEKERIEQKHQQELLTTQLEMQRQTMQHIGREIHDNVGQKLTLASLYAQQLGFTNPGNHLHESLTGIGNLINESLTELRNLSKNLTDQYFVQADIQELVGRECEKINALNTCTATVSFSGPPPVFHFPVKMIVIRVLQEFMQNSLKHSGCTTIAITLNNDPDGFTIDAADNGSGFDMAAQGNKGIGLQNIKKRTEMIGAELLIKSEKNKGTALHLFIPSERLSK